MITFQDHIINVLISKGIKKGTSYKGAIYGTGEGARELFEALEKMGLSESIIYFIERDVGRKEVYGRPVISLESLPRDVDLILVGARFSYDVIEQRIRDYLTLNEKNIKIINVFRPENSDEDKIDYVSFLERKVLRQTESFVPLNERAFQRSENDSKVIAWYLPQYYPIDINNEFHGLGFTEWTNVSQAFPQFVGHYQPHIPYDVGFYDLRDKSTLQRQAELARNYGIYGFCVHYYWFDGTILLDEPLKILLENRDIDIRFCLNWATEDWTMAWDDGFEKIGFKKNIMKQNLPTEPESFMNDVLPYMKDDRYIAIDGRPVLSIYKYDLFPQDDFRRMIESFRMIAKQEGFPDLYVMVSTGSGFDVDCSMWGADALVEYQPNLMLHSGKLKKVFPEGYMNPYYKGHILDVSDYIGRKEYLMEHQSKEFYRCAVTSWDNTARKGKSGGVIYTGLSPEVMKRWIMNLMLESKKMHTTDKDMIFISSWNEWAEGSHLEPDMLFGYAWLQAIREAIEELRR